MTHRTTLYPHRLDKDLLRQVLQTVETKTQLQVGKSGCRRKAVAKGIKEVCFDRGDTFYHGRVMNSLMVRVKQIRILREDTECARE